MRKTVFLLIAGGVACASHRPATSTTTPSTPASRTAAADTTRSTAPMRGGSSTPLADPFPSTYRPFASRPTLIRNATILTAAGPTIRNGSIFLRDGKIADVGTNVSASADAIIIDGTGKYVTPGIIDNHSHIGAGGVPEDEGTQTNDVNEATAPVTANVWVEHSV